MNFCGMHSYKLKFGTVYAYVPRLIFTKYPWLRKAKNYAQKAYFFFRNSMARVKLKCNIAYEYLDRYMPYTAI